MSKKVFINLCVNDLNKSIEYYTKLGYTFNPQFTDENATCMIIDEDHIYAMLIVPAFFKTFTSKEIIDAKKSVEVLNALAFDSREEVDKIADAALSAGGTEARATDDHGRMYTRAIQDLDGHIREYFFMDISQVPQQA